MSWRVSYLMEHLPKYADLPDEKAALEYIEWGLREDVFDHATYTEVMEVETVG